MEKRTFTEEELKRMEKSVVEGIRVSFALEGLRYTDEEWERMSKAHELMSGIAEEIDKDLDNLEP